MPELPEVETIRRALSNTIVGKRICDVRVRDSRLRWPVEADKLRRLIIDREVANIRRRAKYLLVHLEPESILILHLGMSGKLLWLTESQPFHKHDHVVFYFHAAGELRFRDPRRFGLVDALPAEALSTYPRLAGLGLEPLDETVTAEMLFLKAKTSRKPVKNLLMDGHFIVGVGNIYTNEALFRAHLHPQTPANLLTLQDWQRLLSAVRSVLKSAIARGGTTLNDFVSSDGETGYFQLSLMVYGRGGQACPGCGTAIERIVQAGRSSFFCPACQKKRS